MSKKKVDLKLENVTIEAVAAEGKALTHVDGMVVFVDFAVPGDVVDIQVFRKKKNYMEGFISRMIQPSPHRLEAFCEHFGVCGGCRWQPLPYEMQLEAKRQQVYDQLLRRMYVLTANMITNWQLTDSPFLKALHQRPRKTRKDWSISSVRAQMEDFVGSLAMLQLNKEVQNSGNSSRQLHQEHWQLMNDFFDYIDQQMVVSAITLSALQTFCPQKFRVLAEVYRQSTDERVRQRALVGWVFAACCSDSTAWRLFTDVGDTIASLCEEEQTRSELAELQMQLIYCTEAETDTHTIQKEILPDIMNGSNIKMTRKGLVEMDEDGLAFE